HGRVEYQDTKPTGKAKAHNKSEKEGVVKLRESSHYYAALKKTQTVPSAHFPYVTRRLLIFFGSFQMLHHQRRSARQFAQFRKVPAHHFNCEFGLLRFDGINHVTAILNRRLEELF